ncbi:DMT family transporter [Aureimonas fodinaquatilis]|uniref:DMT family transporter n=1 Tax=Aureimonas fodinaquatilis TaxID=2565783 RepID=A0A5B0E2L9_9HYPH|nr:DMT family transporter [Aureimonas fodinaquatilis]KAA0972000.1 DMT family transporter [Aureimonas fodinaquatilis]
MLFVIFAWGGNYTWVKLAVEDGGAWTFNALRYVFAVLLLGFFLLIRRGPGGLLPIAGERLATYVVGFLQIAVMTGGTAFALQFIDASRTVLIAYSMPLWAMLLSLFILGERTTWQMLLGLTLGIGGIAILGAPWSMDWSSRSTLMGSGIALFSTIAWALGSVLYRKRQWRSDFWRQVFGQLLAGAVCSSAAALVLEDRGTNFTPTYTAILLYNAIVPSVLGFWFWARALSRMSVTTASQVLLLSPVFGMVLSAIVLDETLTLSLLVSAVLILIGAGLSYYSGAKDTRAK